MKTFRARIADIEDLSSDTRSLRFFALEGRPFAAASAGSHLDIRIDDGDDTGETGDHFRQYSLWQWDADGQWASVAVKRENEGRGGSRWIHASLRVGDEVTLAGPRNAFELAPAEDYLLIGGGIGVTPIYAMAAELVAQGKPVRCAYLTRGRVQAAFVDKFAALELGERLIEHYDDEHGPCDFDALFTGLSPRGRVFVCGPEGMLSAVQAAAERAGACERLHFERFSALELAPAGGDEAFVIELARSGRQYQIPANESAVKVLEDAGEDVDYACSSGVCGSCIVDVLEGDVEHRDSVLTEAEHAENKMMCLCVSRARGGKLVIDL